MKDYISLGWEILNKGNTRPDRTKTGTKSLFGPQLHFDLRRGFPLVTTKKVDIRPVIAELLWFLEGSTSALRLNELGAKIWDSWALPEDNLFEYDLPGQVLATEYATLKGVTLKEAVAELTACDHADGLSHEDDFNTDPTKGGLKKIVEAGIELKGRKVLQRKGELGPIYGYQWRSWPAANGEHIDQISDLVSGLIKNPYSRRHIISAWNPADLPDETLSPQENVKRGKMALAPCHTMFQFYAEDIPLDERLQLAWEAKHHLAPSLMEMHEDAINSLLDSIGIPKHYLSCKLYQRSADLPVGVPYNIASYSMLIMMIAQVTGMVAKDFFHSFGDVHVYGNQIELFKEQLVRTPFKLPKLTLNPQVKDLFAFKISDFTLEGYEHHPFIRYPVAV